MARWQLVLDLGGDPSGEPTYLRIAGAIIDGIRRGRLSPGDELPGTRALADELGVNRNTAKAAYAELASQGWIAARASSATFVSTDLPERMPPRLTRASARPLAPDAIGFSLPSMDLPPADTWGDYGAAKRAFSGMDPRLLPRATFSRAYRRALATRGDALGYRIGRGNPRFLAALRAMLATSRGIPVDRSVLVTRGSQMALDLIIRALLRPGDVVAVEDPGYAFSWPSFRTAGVELVGVPVDRLGLDVERLAELATRRPIRAVLVTPHAQYPTGVALAAGRRIELLELARRHRMAILEDDFVHEVRFEGRPLLPLASADATGSVLYLGSFSKTFAPALRLGFVVGPEPVIERLTRLRARVDVCGDGVTELAMAELLEDGELQRHVRRITRVLRRRRDVMMEELDRRLGSVVRFERPTGGSALWVEVDPAIDVERWARAALAQGLGFLTGRHFFLDERPHPNLWLGFGGLDETELRAAVAKMARVVPRSRRT